jgi:hypothetical protein
MNSKNYIIVSEYDIAMLEQKVNEYIDAGYKLRGDLKIESSEVDVPPRQNPRCQHELEWRKATLTKFHQAMDKND